MKRVLSVVVLTVVLAAGPARAAPTVTVAPADGARFLVAQRFDLRVEGKGTGPYSATLQIDGVPVPFTSGVQNSTSTDGISLAGYGGFNVRGFSSASPGRHVVKATFTDATGTASSVTSFEVVDPFARRGGTGRPIKNVILMVGDGMGVAHRTAARIVRYGVKGGQPQGWLAMDRFPGTGLVTTHSLNSIITDSAPGMACYASGNHANNNQEGVFPSPGIASPFYAPRVEYMSEYLHRVKGTSLGLVTTADVEDATPAANAVHTTNRNAGQGICDQYLDESDAAGTGTHGTGLAVLMGGGRRWFLPGNAWGSSRSSSNDYPALPADLVAGWSLPPSAAGTVDAGRDLVADFQAAGFAYADTKTALGRVMAGSGPSRLLGLFGYGNMNVALDKIAKRRGAPLLGAATYAVDDYHAPDQPMLDEMTAAALEVLRKNRNGFVLMVEGAHIDKQSHMMDAERAIGEVLELDRAVEVARRFADDSGDTLVVVLADHECSGFSLVGALAGGIDALRVAPPDATKLDPLAAPDRQGRVGTYDAASFPRYAILDDGYPATYDVDGKLLVGYGASGDRYETWLTKPRPVIDSLLPNGVKGELAVTGYAVQPVLRPSEKDSGFFLRGQAVGREQAVHTAADIPLSAYSSRGSKAWQRFVGVQTNTDVFFEVMQATLSGE
ncbi:MAG TPA: alkaline phosphatase [Anaeromyxobacter sp.]